ncbi:MAG: hypothetical protein IPO03_05170 [Bacteroidetes bacterium]|nr:hypothetical protein [Bacteroidota bacterium]
MRIELSNAFERLGNVLIYGTQKVYALDAGPEGPNHPNDKYFVVRKVANEQSWNVEQEMVIVVPIKNEKLKLLEGVITGIPHNCLIIVVSNSDRDDVDRFNMEKMSWKIFVIFLNVISLSFIKKTLKLLSYLKVWVMLTF